MMELTNSLAKQVSIAEELSQEDRYVLVAGFKILVKCLYPYAPHLASEIW